MVEEIRGVTWDLAGERLYPFQAAQYLYNASTTKNGVIIHPFREAKVLTVACATMGGESDWRLRSWHANVLREEDGSIKRDSQGRITIKSIDLGWIQRNADIADLPYRDTEIAPLVQSLFDSEQFGYLDRPALAANEAARLYVDRGWQPWVAYSNGGWRRHLPNAGLAVANFIAVEFMNKQSFYAIR
jgi:hypothetical protein